MLLLLRLIDLFSLSTILWMLVSIPQINGVLILHFALSSFPCSNTSTEHLFLMLFEHKSLILRCGLMLTSVSPALVYGVLLSSSHRAFKLCKMAASCKYSMRNNCIYSSQHSFLHMSFQFSFLVYGLFGPFFQCNSLWSSRTFSSWLFLVAILP